MMWSMIDWLSGKRIIYAMAVIGVIVVVTGAYKIGSELERGKKARELLKVERQKTTILVDQVAAQNKAISEAQEKMKAYEHEATDSRERAEKYRTDLAAALRQNRVWASGLVPGDISDRLRARSHR